MIKGLLIVNAVFGWRLTDEAQKALQLYLFGRLIRRRKSTTAVDY